VTTTAAPAPSVPLRTARAGRRPGTVVARLTARRASVQSAIWGVVFGVLVVSTVSSYASAYPTVADRLRLRASVGGNVGAEALLGPTRRIETVAGWTGWRALGLAMLIGAIWGLLAGTRFLRGEEEAGRWELLLTGATTRGRAAAQALAGLAVALLAMFAVTAIFCVVEGRSHDARFTVSASLFLAVALVASPALFVAVGAFTSQLANTRRRAAGLAAAVFGVCFVLRMVASAASSLRWVRWVTPLGWIDALHPLTGSQVWPLVPLVVLIAGLAVATVRLASARDVGAGVLPDRDTARARTALLGGPTGLAVRLVRGVAIGWIGASAALAFVMGLVARAAAKSISDTPSLRQILERLGGGRSSGAEFYLGFAFLTVATVVALLAASQAHNLREEESEGRVENLLVRAVGRVPWLAGRLGVALALIVATGVLSGFAAWAGAAVEHTNVSLGRLLEGGVNVVPPAVLVLGIGTLAFGILPRAVTIVAYGLVAWSFLVELVGATVKSNRWFLDTSLFHHMKPVPAADADWTSACVMAGIGILAAAVGAVAFMRRDVTGA
jgi:ABC-2 type transport system permease protein